MKIVLPEDRPKIEVPIKDGRTATLSPVLSSDREFFEKGIDALSIESRYARFGQGVGQLTEWELDYLSDVDQRTHVAWGAAVDGEVAGVGRYILPADGGCPELAITVLDEFQRHGVGTALFRALVAIARADGVGEICFEAQSDNRAVLQLIGELEVAPFLDGDTIERRLRIGDIPATSLDDEYLAVIDEVRRWR